MLWNVEVLTQTLVGLQATMPGELWNDAFSVHAVQFDDGFRSRSTYPGAHCVQFVVLPGEYVPDGHVAHDVHGWKSVSAVPTGHAMHDPKLPGPVYVSGLHGTHGVAGLLSASVVPFWQRNSEQFPTDEGGTYVPAPHGTQGVDAL